VPGVLVGHRADSAALVRDRVRADLAIAGVPADAIYEATLIASELLTNAVRHAPALPSGRVAVHWTIEAARFIISVTDGGPNAKLDPRLPAEDAPAGRGLAIVETIADSWGIEEATESKTIWAVYSLSQARGLGDLVSSG
jgi:anti-sigma regulatory factor (Ser/Thr protein kinase)